MRRTLGAAILVVLVVPLAACRDGGGDGDGDGTGAAAATAPEVTATATPTTAPGSQAAAHRCLTESSRFEAEPVSAAAAADALEAMNVCADATLLFDADGLTEPSRAVKDWNAVLQLARVNALHNGTQTDLSAAFAELEQALTTILG